LKSRNNLFIDMETVPQFILASGSPRRAELLSAAGYQFAIHAADVDESDYPSTASPADIVSILARRKAEAVASRFGERIILAADTVVVCDGDVIGKPIDHAHAIEIIRQLSGRTHEVISGVALLSKSNEIDVRTVASVVRINSMNQAEIDAYARTDRWRGKAGAYGLQDENSIAELVDGCRTNVIGLPMTTTHEMLSQIGVLPSR
jgi:septum formation protein